MRISRGVCLAMILNLSCASRAGSKSTREALPLAPASLGGTSTFVTVERAAGGASCATGGGAPLAGLQAQRTTEATPTHRFAIDPTGFDRNSIPQAREQPAQPGICEKRMRLLVGSSVLRLPKIEDGGGAGFEPESLLKLCWSTKGGAWALLPHKLRHASGVVSGRMQLVYLHDNGAKVYGPKFAFEGSNVNLTNFSGTILKTPAEESRFALFRSAGFHNGGHVDGQVYALRSDKIVAITIPSNVSRIVAAADADQDGIDDLFTDVPFTYEFCGCSCSDDTTLFGKWFLLHGNVDGSFSLADDVAKQWARVQCPELPADLSAEDEPDWDWLRCKRVWGASKESLNVQLEQYCKLHPPGEDFCAPCTIRLPMWQGWASATPPFVLH